MRKLLPLLLCMSLYGQSGPYVPKGWVWVDNQDCQGSSLPWRASDKRGHLAMGMAIGSWGSLWAEHNGWKHPWLWGFLMGLAAGIAKEYYDLHRGSGTAEYADVLNTAVGGAIGAITVKIRF